MKPYFYILAVLAVGGVIGFFIGHRTVSFAPPVSSSHETAQQDALAIDTVLERQKEAYRIHDASLLFRDCTSSYIEVNGNSGETLSLEKSIIYYHEQFKPGKTIAVQFKDKKLEVRKNSAVVSCRYIKTSDLFDQMGFTWIEGQGVWLLTKVNSRWQISAFSWVEEGKQ